MIVNLQKDIVGSSVIPIITAPFDANILVSELQLIIKLPSIAEMPLYADDPSLTDEQRDAIFWRQVNIAKNKKVVTYWNDKRLIEFIVFNRLPYYTENLLTRFTSLSSFILQAGSSISLSIEATNSGLLGTGDSLRVWGQVEALGV